MRRRGVFEGRQRRLEASLELAETKGCASVETILKQGSPVREILEFSQSETVDLMILGSRGLSDIAGLFLGSVSHKVNHLVECTCITVR